MSFFDRLRLLFAALVIALLGALIAGAAGGGDEPFPAAALLAPLLPCFYVVHDGLRATGVNGMSPLGSLLVALPLTTIGLAYLSSAATSLRARITAAALRFGYAGMAVACMLLLAHRWRHVDGVVHGRDPGLTTSFVALFASLDPTSIESNLTPSGPPLPFVLINGFLLGVATGAGVLALALWRRRTREAEREASALPSPVSLPDGEGGEASETSEAVTRPVRAATTRAS